MSTEIYRLKQDIQTIEQALGCEPEFNRGTVWYSVGWGILGGVLMGLGILHIKFSSSWVWVRAVITVTLFLGLPYLLSRLARRFASPLTFGSTKIFGSAKDLNSFSLSVIILAVAVGMGFWMSKLTVPYGLFEASMFLICGLVYLVQAWGKPWRRGMLAYALAYTALGFVYPFFPKGTGDLAVGAAITFAGFVGAMILNSQLNSYYANGKASH